MKAKKIVVKQKTRSATADLAIVFGGLLILAAVVFLALRFMPRRHNESTDAQRIFDMTNLAALPADYSIDRGEDMSTARSVWVIHKGAADTARVLVTVIEKDDPSGHHPSLYYAIHRGEDCKKAPDTTLTVNKQNIRVARTFCNISGDILVEEQAIFHISDYYSVSIDESAEKTLFDYPAFATVLNTVLEARPKGKNHLD